MKDAHVAELPGGAIIHDNCVEHRRKSYVCETGKSMKAVGLAVSQTGNCRNIAITLIDWTVRPIVNERYGCLHQPSNDAHPGVDCSSSAPCPSAFVFALGDS